MALCKFESLIPSALSANRPREQSVTDSSVDFGSDDIPNSSLSAMLLSVEYELDIQFTPQTKSAHVSLPLHLYGIMAACSRDAMDYLADNTDLEELVDLALKGEFSSSVEAPRWTVWTKCMIFLLNNKQRIKPQVVWEA